MNKEQMISRINKEVIDFIIQRSRPKSMREQEDTYKVLLFATKSRLEGIIVEANNKQWIVQKCEYEGHNPHVHTINPNKDNGKEVCEHTDMVIEKEMGK